MSVTFEEPCAEGAHNGPRFLSSTINIATPALCALAAISVSLSVALMFVRATTPWARLPDNDYWDNISGVITETGVRLTLSDLLRHNNEHIVFIPKLLYAANYLASSGSNIGLIAYSIAVGGLCSVLLLFMARDLLVDAPLRFALCALLFPLVMLSSKLTHNYFMGMSGAIWLTADLFVILSAAALARAVSTKSSLWLLMSLIAALLGALSYSTAIYMLVVLLFCSLALLFVPRFGVAISKPMLIGASLVIAFVLVIFFAYRTHPPAHPALVFDPVRLAYYVLVYIGSALPLPPILYVVGGLALLSVGAMSIFALVARGRNKEILFWILLFLFAPFNAFMTGVGRAGYGMATAESSRYQSVASLTVIATIVLVVKALPEGEVSRPIAVIRRAILIGLLFGAPLIVVNPINLNRYSARNERKAIAEVALRLQVQGEQHLRAATPAIQQLDRLLPTLRTAHHVPFDWSSRCEKLMDQHIGEAVGRVIGVLQTVSTYEISHGRGRAIELSGRAELHGEAPDCVIIVDGYRTVIGAGVFIPHAFVVEPSVEWRAVALLPRNKPVCALAVFSRTDQLVPISSCDL